jgi:hypothetical protein
LRREVGVGGAGVGKGKGSPLACSGFGWTWNAVDRMSPVSSKHEHPEPKQGEWFSPSPSPVHFFRRASRLRLRSRRLYPSPLVQLPHRHQIFRTVATRIRDMGSTACNMMEVFQAWKPAENLDAEATTGRRQHRRHHQLLATLATIISPLAATTRAAGPTAKAT